MSFDPLFLATAVDAVLRAGEVQMTHLRGPLRIKKKGTIDLVTNVDLAVEREFRRRITDWFPDHDVLAEELETTTAGRSRFCWVFDPIDGTTNYAHGVPFFCASLALEIDGTPVVAAIYDPVHKELFTAERGDGAFLNGEPLRVSGTHSLLDALLCTGFPYDIHETADEVVGLFRAFVARARAVRRFGSAALDLCWVAAGRLDGFWEQRLKPWDVAAGALVVQEAGGTVMTFNGGSFNSRAGEIVASNGLIDAELTSTIARFEVERTGKPVG